MQSAPSRSLRTLEQTVSVVDVTQDARRRRIRSAEDAFGRSDLPCLHSLMFTVRLCSDCA
jgi:hypothetical protein